MNFWMEMLAYLKGGFTNRPAFICSTLLLMILDPISFLSLVWIAFLQRSMPVAPATLAVFSGIYLILTLLLGALALTGRLRALKAVVVYYFSIGLYLFLKGWMGMSGQEFGAWPWVIVWVGTLWLTISRFSIDWLAYEKNKDSPV
jgi:hypothetical protein